MLYADDLVLLEESEQDLQRWMNSLGTYAIIFQMEVNQKRPKYKYLTSQRGSKTYLENVDDR